MTFDILRFLQSPQVVKGTEMPYTHERALQKMETHYDWRTETFPMASTLYQPFLEQGFFYVHKRDLSYRPILVLNLSRAKVLSKKTSSEEMMNLVYAMMDFACEKLMMGGRIEQWSILVDLKDASLTDKLTMQLIMLTLNACNDYFPGRLYRMFVVNGGWAINTILPVALFALIDKITTKRIFAIKDIPSDRLYEHISRANLEEKYGG